MKLEEKSFRNSEQYFLTQKYKSALLALDNTLKEFPNTKYHEQIFFMKFKSSYYLAINSIVSKKQERLEDAIKAYHIFVDSYPKSKWINEAENLFIATRNELEKIKI